MGRETGNRLVWTFRKANDGSWTYEMERLEEGAGRKRATTVSLEDLTIRIHSNPYQRLSGTARCANHIPSVKAVLIYIALTTEDISYVCRFAQNAV